VEEGGSVDHRLAEDLDGDGGDERDGEPARDERRKHDGDERGRRKREEVRGDRVAVVPAGVEQRNDRIEERRLALPKAAVSRHQMIDCPLVEAPEGAGREERRQRGVGAG